MAGHARQQIEQISPWRTTQHVGGHHLQRYVEGSHVWLVFYDAFKLEYHVYKYSIERQMWRREAL